MLGLRFAFLQPHQQSWPTDGTLDWLWPAAERAGVPLALLAADFLPLVGQIAERHPGLKLIVDHSGRPRPHQGRRRPSPTCPSCWRSRSIRTWRSRRRARRATRASRTLPQHPPLPPPALRRLRAASGCSGGPTSRACPALAAMRDAVHRGAAVARRARQGADHGPRALRLARLETARVKVVVTARTGAREFECEPGEKILHAGSGAASSCRTSARTGTCGTCKAKLVSGRAESDVAGRPGQQVLQGPTAEILTCQSLAREDCALEVGRAEGARARRTAPRALGRRRARLAAADPRRGRVRRRARRGRSTSTPGQFALLTVPGIAGARAYSMVNFERRPGACRSW